MPDVTLVVHGLTQSGEAEHLDKALAQLGFVETIEVNLAKELLAISYNGGEVELDQIAQAVRDVGYEPELSPGTENVAEG
ncbi:MAG: heavy-metal-associated domain-containing protein [Rubrobacter sp.]|nr:heavy-metal-associated domain-containing protein [Rubrobacter sp.]